MRFLRDLWIAFFSLREIVNLEVYEIPETHIFFLFVKKQQ